MKIGRGDRIKVYDFRKPRTKILEGGVTNINEEMQSLKRDKGPGVIQAKRIIYTLDTGYTLEILVLPKEEEP